MPSAKEWMLGLPGHDDLVALEEVVLLIRGGQLRATDLVKKVGDPWRAANEIPELMSFFGGRPTTVPDRQAPTDRITREGTAHRTTGNIGRPARVQRKNPAAGTTSIPSKPPDFPRFEAREVPKPAAPMPPTKRWVRLEPLEAKYYSPVDLLRSASLAFDPIKLLIGASMMVPLMVLWSLIMHLRGIYDTSSSQRGLFLLATACLIFGGAFVFMVLAYVTRRQLERAPYGAVDAASHAGVAFVTALAYPAVVLVPSAAAVVMLWVLGLLRNAGPTYAAVLKFLYIVPMFFAFIAIFGGVLYQVASMYVPAVAAIEGYKFGKSFATAWKYVRQQLGRVVLHWLIVTVAVGVIAAVCLGLVHGAIALPDVIFPPSESDVQKGWDSHPGIFTICLGLAYGLGLTLPASLFSTLGTLSYMSLRHPASASLSPSPLEETRDIPPPDATRAADSRPALDVTDDSDEQPLIKD